MEDIYVGRQPIYNRQMKVYGYELLFRRFNATTADVVDGDHATSDVIVNAFMEIGIDDIVGAGMAFINLTRSFIMQKYPLPLNEERVVLEVLEDIEIDDELIEALKSLSARGYTIALDDVVDISTVEPLLEVANIVKFEIMGVEPYIIEKNVARLKNTNIRLLAEKVETHEEFEFCKELGFHYFQGFFFSKPHIVQGKKVPESRLALLRLLSRLQTPKIEFKEMEEIIGLDVSLSYKLLKLINSSFYARPRQINSIRQALTLLGIRQIKDWVSLLVLSSIEDKPRELMVTAMVRGKMTEFISEQMRMPSSEIGFTVGLFSVLDALLDMPMDQVLSSLPLTADVTSALQDHKGTLGEVLNTVLAYERGEWDAIENAGLKPDILRDAYLKSVTWAMAVSGVL